MRLRRWRGRRLGSPSAARSGQKPLQLFGELADPSAYKILDAISDGVLCLDRNRKVLYSNRALKALLFADQAENFGPLIEALGEHREKPFDVVLHNSYGAAIPVTVTTGRLVDEQGGPIGTFYLLCPLTPAREEPGLRLAEIRSIVGKSKKILELMDLVVSAAASNSTVLLEGESGTGKELVARAIYQMSARREKAFIAVNCASLSGELLESELFGHMKGSFTGAVYDRPGRFELANHGTLFLDEIGDMSPAAQAEMLRVLQEQEFERVGGDQNG